MVWAPQTVTPVSVIPKCLLGRQSTILTLTTVAFRQDQYRTREGQRFDRTALKSCGAGVTRTAGMVTHRVACILLAALLEPRCGEFSWDCQTQISEHSE